MFCKNLVKKLNGKLRCKIIKQEITLDWCDKCSNKEYKTNKPIKKKSNNKEEVTKETYNIVFNRDKGKCALCGTAKNLQLHHILGRSKLLTNKIDNCIMLCENCHINVVHKNQKKYRPLLLEIIERRNNGRS